MELREAAGEPRGAEGLERALAGVPQPARGPEEQVDMGIRRAGGGEQRGLVPVYPVMLGSQGRWPLAELGWRPAGAGAGAPRAVDGLGPAATRRLGSRPLIRCFVGSVGRLTCSARRLRLLCSRGHLPWDWLLPVARRREPG